MDEEGKRLYAVGIRYPRKQGEDFDFRHWAETHMPLGVATLRKSSGISPRRVMVQHETFGMDGKAESADSYATVWLLFDTRDGLDGFMKLHNDPIKSADLSRDFGNYAPLPPAIVLGEITVFDPMDPLLERGNRLLEGSRSPP